MQVQHTVQGLARIASWSPENCPVPFSLDLLFAGPVVTRNAVKMWFQQLR
jgi:hypothetical protein